jgi:hypothetical protein
MKDLPKSAEGGPKGCNVTIRGEYYNVFGRGCFMAATCDRMARRRAPVREGPVTCGDY